jgi:hypothetical protein
LKGDCAMNEALRPQEYDVSGLYEIIKLNGEREQLICIKADGDINEKLYYISKIE